MATGGGWCGLCTYADYKVAALPSPLRRIHAAVQKCIFATSKLERLGRLRLNISNSPRIRIYLENGCLCVLFGRSAAMPTMSSWSCWFSRRHRKIRFAPNAEKYSSNALLATALAHQNWPRSWLINWLWIFMLILIWLFSHVKFETHSIIYFLIMTL